MAVITKTLRASGGDYTTMSAWEAGEQTDLVAAGNSHVLECYNDWPSGLNGTVEINGWITSASNTLTIKAAAGHEHNGVSGSGFWMWYDSARVMDVRSEYVIAQDLELFKTTTNLQYALSVENAGNNFRAERLLVRTEAPNSPALFSRSSAGTIYRNCLFKGTDSSGKAALIDRRPAGMMFDNCTFVGETSWSSGTVVNPGFRNCAFFGVVNDPGNAHVGAATNNAFSTLTTYTFGTNQVTGITSADFVDAANDDYRINQNSALYNAGTDLSVDFTDDLRGTATRYATSWDIGAFKFDVVTKTLRSAGGDYTTTAAWEAAEQTDLVAAGESAVLECYNDWPSGLAGECTIGGWTTSNLNTITIRAANGHDNAGVVDAGVWLSHNVNWAYPLRPEVSWVYVEGIQFSKTGSGAAIYFTAGDCFLDRCIIKGPAGAACMAAGGASSRLHFYNMLFVGGARVMRSEYSFKEYSFYNCTAVAQSDYALEFRATASQDRMTLRNFVACSPSATNVLFLNSASAFDADHVASSDTSAPGANSIHNVTESDFVDYANGDFHLSAGSVLRGAGVNLYSDFQYDIDGDEWPSSGAWDIGADSFVASGPAARSATIAIQETGADTPAIIGTVPIAATVGAQETGADTPAIIGTVPIAATVGAQETGEDTFSLTATVTEEPRTATISIQEEGADTLTIAAGVTVSAVMGAQETGEDTPAIIGTVPIAATVGAQETGADTPALTLRSAVTVTVAIQETGQDEFYLRAVGEFEPFPSATQIVGAGEVSAISGHRPNSTITGVGGTSAISGHRPRSIITGPKPKTSLKAST